MAWQTDRILVYDRSLSFLFELAPDEITKRVRTEELNGTHELELVTSRVLHEGYRLLTVDNTGKWREHVVYKPDEDHAKGRHATGTYVCVWSLQYDLTVTVEGGVAQPGMGSSCTAANAVRAALGGQTTWEVGSCDVGPVAAGEGCAMVYNNAWDRLKQVASSWGGEVDAEIEVDASKVVTRNVVLRAHLGSTKVTRRFDWGEDLTRIKRTPDPGPYYCRVVPLGKGQREYAEDDETEFDWPLDISEETPDGRIYIQDDDAATVFRIADGNGGWRYPTKIVRYDEDDPELLLNAALADLHNHTRPGAGYEADVLQFSEAGMDVQGVELGDDTQCVDYGFNPDAALRVQGRVTRMVVNELAPKTDTKLTIGSLGTSLATALKGLIGSSTQDLANRVNHIEGDVDAITDGGTIAYVEALLETINSMIAASGGYTYLVNGQGSITYDKAVANPLIGTEATQVTQMKGGSLRFANSKKQAFQDIDDWDWKTVITPEGFLGLAATIAAITTGYIGSSGDTYIDLDNHTAQLGPSDGPHLVIESNGVLVYDSSTVLGFFGFESNTGIVRVGQASQGNVVMSGSGYVDVRNGSTVTAHFGWGTVNIWGSTTTGAYYSLGTRKSGYSYGKSSFTAGEDNVASGYLSSAIGYGNEVTGRYSAAIGRSNKVSSDYASVALGYGNEINSDGADVVAGYKLTSGTASRSNQSRFICGTYNAFNSDDVFEVGWGTESSRIRENVMSVTTGGIIRCTSVSQSSDRRVKTPIGDLTEEEAGEFVRSLKPSKFLLRGEESLGFYAQDVEETIYGDILVSESNNCGFEDFKSLDYTSIIAPLVAYAQGLEKQIDQLMARLDALEGKR